MAAGSKWLANLKALVLTLAFNKLIYCRHIELKTASDLFNCQLTLSPLPDSYVQLSAHNLLLPNQRYEDTNNRSADPSGRSTYESITNKSEEPNFEELDYKNHQDSGFTNTSLNPNLPFVVFTNGFNHYGVINGSWMENVARILTQSRRKKLDNSNGSSTGNNMVFLPWTVEGIIASDILAIPLAYYRTMANYKLIVEEFGRAIDSLVEFVERNRRWPNAETRLRYYAKWKFYAHSLGSHIASEAIGWVKRRRPWIRFGKLTGMDPALPCFLDQQHGLSALKLAESVDQVAVVHTNAALVAAYSGRGNLEIVLNGGTFQPACAWYDFRCSHVRSTDVLSYLDEQCQMVAYECSKYEQFKLGACNTCEGGHKGEGNCILVNLPEQHVDEGQFLAASDEDQVRQLADETDNFTGNNLKRSKPLRSRSVKFKSSSHDKVQINGTCSSGSGSCATNSTQQRAAGFYFVNTNAQFRDPPKTHCLQHYQLRLLKLADNPNGDTICPMSSFYIPGSEGLRVQLYHEYIDSVPTVKRAKTHTGKRSGYDKLFTWNLEGKQLAQIVDDKLFTGLLNFVGPPQLFVGAVIYGIDLERWSKCLVKERAFDKIRFKLDVAFMSHTKSNVRHAYSSILCGQWNPTDIEYHNIMDNNTNIDDDNNNISASHKGDVEDSANNYDADNMAEEEQFDNQFGDLTLELCKQSDLINVSGQIDEIIDQIKFYHQYDSWQVSLLDNLFYLYSKWEPLRIK